MKIQPKVALYEEHGGNLGNLHTEKTVFANCHHPFIVDMFYALQTEYHAILVLSLVDGGDLNDLLWRSPHGRLNEFHARLYCAQIALALSHLHEIGILYRDLKPENVLICSRTGNIKLTDMGLAAPIVVCDQKATSPTNADKVSSEQPPASLADGGAEQSEAPKRCLSTDSPSSSVKRIDLSTTRTDLRHSAMSIAEHPDDEEFKEFVEVTDENNNGFDSDDSRNPNVTKLSESEIDSFAELALTDDDTPLSAVGNQKRMSCGMIIQSSSLGTKSMKQLLDALDKKGGNTAAIHTEKLETAKKKIKRMSVVGTQGFMAPEIVGGKAFRRKERKGYGESVDWFALGVTCYVMLTGNLPFMENDGRAVSTKTMEKEFPRDANGRIRRPSGYATLMKTVLFPGYVSHSACHICKDLMNIHADQRLGAGGLKEVKAHDWFVRSGSAKSEDLLINNITQPECDLEPLDFDKVLNCAYDVPGWQQDNKRSRILTRVYEGKAKPKYNHYEHMMATFDIRSYSNQYDWYQKPFDKQQEVFDKWDFISSSAMKGEMSAAMDDDTGSPNSMLRGISNPFRSKDGR